MVAEENRSHIEPVFGCPDVGEVGNPFAVCCSAAVLRTSGRGRSNGDPAQRVDVSRPNKRTVSSTGHILTQDNDVGLKSAAIAERGSLRSQTFGLMVPTSSSRHFAYLLQQLFDVGVFDFEDLELRRHLLQVVAVGANGTYSSRDDCGRFTER